MPRVCGTIFTTMLLLAPFAVQAAEEAQVFNGKNLDGWVWRGKTAEEPNPFQAKEGILHCTGKPAGYLRTEKKYTNFDFQVEWRWPEESKPGNNGVLLRVQDGEHFYNNTWPKSIEAQLANQGAGDILTIGEFALQTGRNKGRYTPKMKDSNEKPQGQWNVYRAVMKGGDIKLFVNGELQNEGTDAALSPGYIALQSEGAPIEFRNLRLTVLGD